MKSIFIFAMVFSIGFNIACESDFEDLDKESLDKNLADEETLNVSQDTKAAIQAAIESSSSESKSGAYPVVFTTPNYPQIYDQDETVEKVIYPPSGANAYILIVDGSCESHWDWLQIREMSGNVLWHFSGAYDNFHALVGSNRPVKIVFYSDVSIVDFGFEVRLQPLYFTPPF